MVIRAKSLGIKSDKNNCDDDIHEMNDGLVMVLFPYDTWEKVKKLADILDMETAAVLSVAIERMEEEIRSKDDA